VSVSVVLEYQIEVGGECGSYRFGQPRTQACIDVSHGWPSNRIILET